MGDQAVTSDALGFPGDLVRRRGVGVVPCRRYEWSEHLHTTVASGFGYRATFNDGARGPVRRSYREARMDMHDPDAAQLREDVSTDKERGE